MTNQEGTPDPAPSESEGPAGDRRKAKRLLHPHLDAPLGPLVIGALGVVFGDIGTSPLYAMRESFAHHAATPERIYGILSLILWALILVISIKYVWLMLQADNHGEGGILALVSRVSQSEAARKSWFPLLLTLALLGTSLLYGDGMITPALSVLSAVEGLGIVDPKWGSWVIPITVIILALLFFFQSRGMEKVGRLLGPVTLVWFMTLAGLGIAQIAQEPQVFKAVSPHFAIQYLFNEGLPGFFVLGSVFLVAAGGEAMYTDMIHFGRRPIQLAWFWLVFPCLLLNYFGQGALLLHDPSAVDNPFFKMTPLAIRLVIVLLATLASIIASQAVISGAFALTVQAIRSGYLPRLRVLHTSARARGEIYVPTVNWILMACCVALVLGFQNSSHVAAAYGLGVNMEMLIVTVLFFALVYYEWKWPLWKAISVCGLMFFVESTFMIANFAKIAKGGWVALVVGCASFILITTWKNGRRVVGQMLNSRSQPLSELIERLKGESIHRAPRTAIFMYGNPTGVPPGLLSNMRHNKVLHARNVLLAVEIADLASLPPSAKIKVTKIADGFFSIRVRFGYMERPSVPDAISQVLLDGEPLQLDQVTFFLGRETVIAKADRFSGLYHWQEQLFAVMVRNATDATRFFHLPPDQVVELGTQLEI